MGGELVGGHVLDVPPPRAVVALGPLAELAGQPVAVDEYLDGRAVALLKDVGVGLHGQTVRPPGAEGGQVGKGGADYAEPAGMPAAAMIR